MRILIAEDDAVLADGLSLYGIVAPEYGWNDYAELNMRGKIAVVLAGLGMLGYIWWRFEWNFAIGAIATLVLDTTKTVGFFALMGLDFNLTYRTPETSVGSFNFAVNASHFLKYYQEPSPGIAELLAAQDQMVLLGRKTAPERVASAVLDLAGQFGRPARQRRLRGHDFLRRHPGRSEAESRDPL